MSVISQVIAKIGLKKQIEREVESGEESETEREEKVIGTGKNEGKVGFSTIGQFFSRFFENLSKSRHSNGLERTRL